MCVCIFTFSHLADAFIQSDLQMMTMEAIKYICIYVLIYVIILSKFKIVISLKTDTKINTKNKLYLLMN